LKDAGSKDVVTRANQKFKKVLQGAQDSLIDLHLEKDIKAYMKAEGCL